MRHLRGIIYDDRVIREWSMYLPFAQRIMNSMYHSSTGVKPCQIVFGREFSQEFIKSVDGEESRICVLRGVIGSPNDGEPTEERMGVLDEEEDEETWLRDIK